MSEAVDRKREAKRQAILDAAVSLFAERGCHPTRMVDIAESLALQKAALYYYVDSKEAVLELSDAVSRSVLICPVEGRRVRSAATGGD